jgi:hypothetical protein
MGHDPQLKDLCERVLDLFDGLSVSDYRAAGMMLLSVAAFKMQPQEREDFLDGIEWTVAENADLFDRHARRFH